MLTKELLKGLEKIDTQKKRRKAIRKKLVALAAESGNFDSIRDYVEFGLEVRKQLDKKEKNGENQKVNK